MKKIKRPLLLAVLLHDTGYSQDVTNHEEESTIIAKEFLTEQNISNQQIEKISRLIMATKMEHEPIDLLEKIIEMRMHRILQKNILTKLANY